MDDVDQKKNLNLPENVKTFRCTFSLENMSEIKKEDMTLITHIISFSCYTIAQRHRNVDVFLTCVTSVYKEIKLEKYVLHIILPKNVAISSLDLAAIHQINLELISDAIVVTHRDDGISLEISVYSKSNPFVVENVSICHIRMTRLNIVTYQDDNESGHIKRKRKI
jgi:hypothetical protein